MNWKELDKSKCIDVVESWNGSVSVAAEGFYKTLSEKLTTEYNKIELECGSNKYLLDLKFGLYLHQVLRNEFDFSYRDASNDNVWRYLAVIVIPNLIYLRCDNELNHDFLYLKSRRIWPKKLWWYIELSFNESYEKTFEILKNNTTDEIMNLVERTGNGYRVELYRAIMKKFSTISKTDKNRGKQLFRNVLKLNTVTAKTVEPTLFEGGIEGYVDYLFGFFLNRD